MIENGSVERPDFLGRLAVVILFLIIANLLFHLVLTNFWLMPIDIQTKLGVASYESLILILLSVILMSPCYMQFCFSCRKASSTLLLIVSLVIATFQVTSWLFYRVFERLLDTYAIQMLFSDTGQIWGYLFKLPSISDPAAMTGVVVFLVAILMLVFSNSKDFFNVST